MKSNQSFESGRDNIVCIELGCGERKIHEFSIGIDKEAYEDVDIVGDALEELKKLPAASVDLLIAHHFLEHTEAIQEIFIEAERVLAPGGRFEGSVPHFSNPFYYSDPTHRTFFGLYTFKYFCRCDELKRPVPDYVKTSLLVADLKLGFTSYRPRYIRHGLKKIAEFIFNFSWYLKEVYEENFCWLVPCYEIKFFLEKERIQLMEQAQK